MSKGNQLVFIMTWGMTKWHRVFWPTVMSNSSARSHYLSTEVARRLQALDVLFRVLFQLYSEGSQIVWPRFLRGREGGNQGKVSPVHWPFPLVQEHLSSDVNAKVDYSYGIFLQGREAIKKRSLMFTDPSQPSPPWPIRRHSKPALIFI